MIDTEAQVANASTSTENPVEAAQRAVERAKASLAQLEREQQAIPEKRQGALQRLDATAVSALKAREASISDSILIAKVTVLRAELELVRCKIEVKQAETPVLGQAVTEAQQKAEAARVAFEEAQQGLRVAQGNMWVHQRGMENLYRERSDLTMEAQAIAGSGPH